MYLRSLTLKGFKSFPERTFLEFGPGVSVVVGPNGSGKSNITDAVLWALGEQSPHAVRGQAMQDVIFGGGPGVKAREAAEVELVLDNSDGSVALPMGEISIYRRLDRAGEGEYRLCGARCRLVDVLEALSDTGLGKEAHSVISQGRIESVVTSRPRERRMLIEEAAGLSKHRKRRRRAQLKLERTQQNLDRALDVEREARSRLRPLERQARAAELHERLERQTLEAQLELARHGWAHAHAELGRERELADRARQAHEAIEHELEAVMAQRTAAERRFAEGAERRESLTRRLFGARSALERLQLRGDQLAGLATALEERLARGRTELEALGEQERSAAQGAAQAAAAGAQERLRALEAELAAVEERHARELAERAAALERERAGLERERTELERELAAARAAAAAAREQLEAERGGRSWEERWRSLRSVLAAGVERALSLGTPRERAAALDKAVDEAERLARAALGAALGPLGDAEREQGDAERQVRELEQRAAELAARERRYEWMLEQRATAAEQGPLAVRRAQLRGELAAERRQAERITEERAERRETVERLRARHAHDVALAPLAERVAAAARAAAQAAAPRIAAIEAEMAADRTGGAEIAGELRACAERETEVHGRLRHAGEELTEAEVSARRAHDRASEARAHLEEILGRLELPAGEDALASAAALDDEEVASLEGRLERLGRRRAQLGPVNPLAREEHAHALAHVEDLSAQRGDLEGALSELRTIIRQTDRRIRETFEATFASVAERFTEVIAEVFPGGSGRLRLVDDEPLPRPVLGGADSAEDEPGADGERPAGEIGEGVGRDPRAGAAADGDGTPLASEDVDAGRGERLLGVEIEITPAGKSSKRLSLLSGGEKSMTALAFLFAVFLAKPCPFYVLDEVEAALDDLNIERFLTLLRRCARDAQFIVMTHQKRTMEAADWLYGVSMAHDGSSKVISRRLGPPAEGPEASDAGSPDAGMHQGARAAGVDGPGARAEAERATPLDAPADRPVTILRAS
jgi:chromosome segregation protein